MTACAPATETAEPSEADPHAERARMMDDLARACRLFGVLRWGELAERVAEVQTKATGGIPISERSRTARATASPIGSASEQ